MYGWLALSEATRAMWVARIDHIPIRLAALGFVQSSASAIFVSVGNNILQNGLFSAGDQRTGIDIKSEIAARATHFRSIIFNDELLPLITIYNSALRKDLLMIVPLLGFALFSSLKFEWKSVRGKKVNIQTVRGLE